MVCLSSTSSFFHGRFKNHDLSPSPPPSSLPFARSVAVASSSPHALKTAQTEYLRCEQGSVGPSVSEESKYATSLDQGVDVPPPRKEERSISGIHVPRQKYISVSKVDLLDAILSMCRSEQEIEEFKRFAKLLRSRRVWKIASRFGTYLGLEPRSAIVVTKEGRSCFSLFLSTVTLSPRPCIRASERPSAPTPPRAPS